MKLKDAKINELRSLAKDLGLIAKGTKSELITLIATKKRELAMEDIRGLYHIYISSSDSNKSNIAKEEALKLCKIYGLKSGKYFN